MQATSRRICRNGGRAPIQFFVLAAMFIAGLVLPAAAHAQGQVPPAFVTRLSYVGPVNGTFGTRDYQGKAGHVSANSRGDVFFVDTPYNYASDNAFLVEVPAGTGNEVELLSGIGYSQDGNPVTVDAQDNLYLADEDGFLIFVPFINGQYAISVSNVSPSSKPLLPACNFPITSNTSDCSIGYNDNSLDNYVQGGDLGVDAAGNIYVIDTYDGISMGTINRLIQVTPNGAVSVLVDNLTEDGGAQIAVDAAGDIYYCDNSKVYFYSAASGYTSPTTVGAGLLVPSGVGIDRSGNIYISDTGHLRIVEIPNINGTIDSANQYTLNDKHALVGFNGGTQNGFVTQGIGVDGYGNVYYVGSSSNSINQLAINYDPFGPFALTGVSGTEALNLYMTGSQTLSSVAVTGPAPGGVPPFAISNSTCVNGTTYAAGFACSFKATYTASAEGLQTGTVTAFNSANSPIAAIQLNGIGQAPAIDIDPGTLTSLGTGWKQPDAITVDGAGNVFVADAASGNVYEISGGSQNVIATGLDTPTALVVDGADNLFVGNSGAGTVVELPLLATGTYGPATALISGLSGPSGLAIDGNNDLYVADSGNSRVLRLASAGGGPQGSLVVPVGSGFKTPVGLAIDSSNNLYVSDSGLGEVVQVAIPTSEQTTVLSGLATAAGVAVDAAGDVYAADSGAQSIYRVAAISGVIDKNFQTTLAAIVATPVALAVDNAGNLYAADAVDSAVGESLRTVGLLNFGNVNVGATSSTVSAVISNGGTAQLLLNTPYFTATGSTSSFAMQSSSDACSSAETLVDGANCTLAADFAPLAPGQVNETLVFSSNAANTTSQSLEFVGTGSQLIKGTLAIAVTSPTGTIQFGEPVTLTATFTPDSQGPQAPTGTVTFYVDTVAQKPVALANDSATIMLTGLTGGSHTITASYSGDATYASAASAPLSLSIATETTITSIALGTNNVFLFPTSAAVGAAVTFTATVQPSGAGTPTGTVTFESGTTVIGTAQVAPQTNSSNQTLFVASLTTSTLAAGTYNVVAIYDGDANFTMSTSSGVSILIAVPTISMTANTNQITGNGAGATLSFESVAGFGTGAGTGGSSSDTADLSCLGLPAYATCSFTPAFASVAPQSAANGGKASPSQVQFTVVTDQAPVKPPQLSGVPPLRWASGHRITAFFLLLLFLAPSGLLGAGLRPSRRKATVRLLMLLLLLGAASIGMNGCGSSSQSFITPNGTYQITVNATITQPGTTTPTPAQTLTFTLTVN